MHALRSTEFETRDLGRIAYRRAYDIQIETHARVLSGEAPPTLLILEHDPVITATPRVGSAAHLLALPDVLEREGIEVVETDRGGDITYHGPGQIVVYPIVPLNAIGLNVRQYIAALEAAIIGTLAGFRVEGRRDPAGIGVWVGGEATDRPARRPPAKVAAIGVRVRRWVTLHGLALNVTTNLDHFRHIVPCGLPLPVTSLRQLMGDRCPEIEEVKQVLLRGLRRSLRSGECSTP